MTIEGTLKVNKLNILPRGCIIAFNSIIFGIPDGWLLCDGTKNTPDLRGRFILGAGQGKDLTDRKLNDQGGTEKHILSESEIPTHTHRLSFYNDDYNEQGGDDPKNIDQHQMQEV